MDHYFTNNENLKSELTKIKFSYDKYELFFVGDNGVFSKNHIDYGSYILLETFIKNYSGQKNVLDVGCGYGFIGLSLAKILGVNASLIDVNKRALHLAKVNAKENKLNVDIFESDAYQNVKNKYDVIITNPPVRAGKKVLLAILEQASKHLNADGQLWYVLRKDHGAKSMEKLLNKHYEINLMEKSKGFYVYCCKKH